VSRATSANQIVLALLGAARGRSLSAPVFVTAGDILGVSSNAMRVALSRLSTRGDLVMKERGRYALAPSRLGAIAHVRTYRTGFAPRASWSGGFVGVLTAHLSRKNAALVARRQRALELSGFREFRHGLWVRPDNLEGGRAAISAHLARLGLDSAAEVIEVRFDASQLKRVEKAWAVSADATRANSLTRRVQRLIAGMSKRPLRTVAAQSFWLGDEVLRFLARDPLLPATIADPEPRSRLAEAMATLDERGYAAWASLLEELGT
jgi:phenylacetic acid degradation operon negative regulatory protein